MNDLSTFEPLNHEAGNFAIENLRMVREITQRKEELARFLKLIERLRIAVAALRLKIERATKGGT